MADNPEKPRTQFPGQRPPDWQPPSGTAKQGGVPGWLIVVLVVGGVALLGSMAGNNPGAGSAPAGGDAPVAGAPATAVSSAELWQAFQQNEVAAMARYGDRALAVTGKAAGVDLDFMDEPVVKLETPNQFMPVQADFDDGDKAAVGRIVKGMTVTVTCGKLSEVAGSPMLDDCRLGQ